MGAANVLIGTDALVLHAQLTVRADGNRYRIQVTESGATRPVVLWDCDTAPSPQIASWADAFVIVYEPSIAESASLVDPYFTKIAHYRDGNEFPLLLVNLGQGGRSEPSGSPSGSLWSLPLHMQQLPHLTLSDLSNREAAEVMHEGSCCAPTVTAAASTRTV